MDVDEVCEAIAAALTAAELTIHGHRLVATSYAPEGLTPPAHFFTAEFTGNYDKTFGNALVELTLTCRLMLSRTNDKAGQQMGRKLASTGVGTIHAAFRAMRGEPGESALRGACDDLYIQRVQGPRLLDIGEASFYVLEFTIFVMG